MNLFKALFKGSFLKELSWYTSAQIIVQISAFLSAIIIARYLGPTNLGLLSFVQNYVGILLTVGGGMEYYFTWKIAKSENYFDDVQKYLGYKFSVYILLTVIGIILAWIVMPKDIAFMISIVLIPVSIQSLGVFSIYAIATNRARLMSIVQVVSSLSLIAVKIALAMLEAPLYMFVVVVALDMILAGILISMYFLTKEEWKGFFSTIKIPSFVSSVTFIYTIRFSVLALVFWQLLLRVDQMALATFTNAYTLGIYSAAVKIAEVPNFLAGVISAALISRIAKISNQDTEYSKDKLRTIMLGYFLIGSCISLGIILFAPLIVNVLYGDKFIDSILVLKAYALSIPGMFMNYFFLGIYGARDKYKQQILIFGVAVTVNVILVYALTPIMGIMGAALSTSLAYTISAVWFYFNYKK
jgi:O-antigen/teichoic acid export membrane protein